MKSTQKHSENSANQGQVIRPSELRKNALVISQSDSSNFALYMINREIPKNLFEYILKQAETEDQEVVFRCKIKLDCNSYIACE